MEKITFKNPDMAWDISALVLHPPKFDPSASYPTLIAVHPFGSCKEQTSGAVYGLGVFLALRRPQMPIYFFFIRMPLWVLVGVFMVGRELVTLVLLHGPIGSTLAHLTGALFGLLYERRHARPVFDLNQQADFVVGGGEVIRRRGEQ